VTFLKDLAANLGAFANTSTTGNFSNTYL
jgi:hypothetical protein